MEYISFLVEHVQNETDSRIIASYKNATNKYTSKKYVFTSTDGKKLVS